MDEERPERIGEYRITCLLGEGAVARVYGGVQEQTGQAVAIKVLREGHNPEHRTVERFIAEVRAVKAIRHPNIIDIYGFGTLPDGRPYFVMEYRPGMTLQQRIDRDGPLTFLEAAPIFTQACSALQAAHERGVVHRDLKPDNIYLADTPRGPPLVKVLDFGIAKLVTQQSSAALTQVGSTVGTPLYMSPEQIRALPLDARSDIYTLGVTMFQALTGEVPFFANSHAQTATMHLSQAAPRPSETCDLLPIPEIVDHIVLRCLEKDPNNRFASMAQLKEAIEQAVQDLLSTRQLSGSRNARPRLPSVAAPTPPPAAQPASSTPASQGPRPQMNFVPLVEQSEPAPSRTGVPSGPALSQSPPAATATTPSSVPASPVLSPAIRPQVSPHNDVASAPATPPLARQRPAVPRRQPWVPSTQLLLGLLMVVLALLAIALGQMYLGLPR
ncbi:MAG: protein kinase [Myxococcales bacterium]|nr:protein kinase [Myxococcota bacterium]MDW8283769.1 protein kinase [Myxococcales bacterium]